jgi:regulatory protein
MAPKTERMSSHGGPVVTGLVADPRRAEVVRVLVDGRPYCAVPATAAAAAGVRPGVPLDSELLDRLGALADQEGAYRAVLRALERRSFARTELGRRLVRKGHRPEAVEHALERAAGVGLLDDAAFARSFVETRSARGRGPARLLRDLLAMGIERRIIDAAISAHWEEGSERQDLPRALVARRARQLGQLPRDAKRRRLLAFLARRGFTGPAARDLVREALMADG